MDRIDLTEEHPGDFLVGNGAVRHQDGTWTLSTDVLLEFLQLSRATGALLPDKERSQDDFYTFGKVSGIKGAAAAASFAYQTGVPEEQAALYDRFSKDSTVWVTVDTDNPQQKASLIALLEENGVYVTPESKGVHFSTDHRMVALMMPVRLLKPSSERPESNIIFSLSAGTILQRRYWLPEALETARSGPIGTPRQRKGNLC